MSLSLSSAPLPSSFCEALAACHGFIQSQARGVAFEPTPALRALWARQGAALSARLGPDLAPLEVVAAVRRAWLLESAPNNTGSLAAITERDVPIVFAHTAQPLALSLLQDDPDQRLLHPYDAALHGAITMWLRPRPPVGPRVFALQQEAFEAADALPWCGFLMTWAQDVAGGSKQYLVASLDDFWHYYRGLAPATKRNHYEIVRTGCRVPFMADLEYPLDIAQNREFDPHALVRALKLLVEQLWLQETGVALDPAGWILYDSCSDPPRNEDVAMELGSDDEEPHEVSPDSDAKVSFHLVHRGATFADLKEAHGGFCQRLEQAVAAATHTRELMVWKWVWNAQTRRKEPTRRFFLDQTIYSANRCFRMPYSTKAGQQRYLWPVVVEKQRVLELNREHWERGLVTLDAEPSPAVAVVAPQRRSLLRTSSSSVAVAAAAAAAAAPERPELSPLAFVVQRHFQPERMREWKLEDNGLCTFSMVLHECREICHDTHNNQVYAVADLKRRVFYAKCHADRSKTGPEHPFPESLDTLSLVDTEHELQPGGTQSTWVFPAPTASAQWVLRFCRAVFGSSGVAARIPLPGAADVVYSALHHEYEVPIGPCDTDGGQLLLSVYQAGASIRCAGGTRCNRQGWRLVRPSRSANVRVWDLRVLLPQLPPPAPDALLLGLADAAAAGVVAASSTPAAAFLEERNFLAALNFPNAGADPTLYDDRLGIIEGWAAEVQQRAPAAERSVHGVHVVAAQVKRKASVMRAILMDAEMESVYRECLAVAPDFAYPTELVPRGARTLVVALWVWLARSKGYKRVGEDFYVPTTTPDGERVYYTCVPMALMMTRTFSFERMPNLCALMWSARNSGDMEHMLRDENHWPSLAPSKRYLGFRNVVYDLEQNVALTWDEAKRNPDVMPFNCLDAHFPLDALQEARDRCPVVSLSVDGQQVEWRGPWGVRDFLATPLFDGPLLDQGFEDDVMAWLYAFFGRMFHRAGKNLEQGGDNWEIVPCCQGAPGTFKSSLVSLLQSYLQPSQVGVIATKTEQRFPIAALAGKLMVFLTEMAGCDIDKELLKQMVSGESICMATKFKTATTIPNWDVPLWFAGNLFLRLYDVDGSLERRFGVFPFTRVLRQGQGDVGLVQRIIDQEQALVLIKCNTLYLAMKRAIQRPVQALLPPLLRQATSQALMEHDSLRAFLLQECIVERGVVEARISWAAFWEAYVGWCRATGQTVMPGVGPHHAGVMALLDRLGIRLHVHRGHPWLVYLRPRIVEQDGAFQSVFEVRGVLRHGRRRRNVNNNNNNDDDDDDDGDAEAMQEDSAASSSSSISWDDSD